MPKIRKYQHASSDGIQFTPLTPAQAYAQSTTKNFGQNFGINSISSSLVAKKNPLFSNGFLNQQELAKTARLGLTRPSMQSSISSALKSDSVSDKVGKGFMSGLGGLKGTGGDLIGMGSDLLGAGLEAAGVKKAETMGGGEQLAMQGLDVVGKTLVKSGGPLAIIGGAMLAAKVINEYGGQKNKAQGTAGIGASGNLGGYSEDISTNAGKKNSAIGSYGLATILTGGLAGGIFGKNKKTKQDYTNMMTARADKSNLLKSRAGFAENQNQLAAGNSYGDVATRNQQKLAGGVNTNVFSSKKGGVINPKKLSNIKNKANYKVRKAQEGSEVDDGQKFQKGGILDKIYAKYPAFKNMGEVTLKADKNFTRSKTGVGDIEYFSPDPTHKNVTYPNHYSYNHPKVGTHGIVYNPTTNNEQSIMLDMLHGMTVDPVYNKHREEFKAAFISAFPGYMKATYDPKKNRDGFDQYVNNEIDGQIRNLMYEGDRNKGSYSEEEAQARLSNPEVKKTFGQLKNYLNIGNGYMLPQIDITPSHALGGKINVIPEGALHAHKNNYDGDLGDQVTNKGIPVITYEDDGKIVQHAEIEHSEIIFNKDVTDKLEAWFKEYNETESSTKKAELETKCGKFLSEEILENTEDRVGLLNTTE